MEWISIKERKPSQSAYYYWKGKSNYGGRSYFDSELGEFEFGIDVPVNKIDEEYLLWLEENNHG